MLHWLFTRSAVCAILIIIAILLAIVYMWIADYFDRREMMNWKLYYETIKSQEDYDKLCSTGMQYEIFELLPSSFQQGQEFYKEWKWANE